MSDTKTPRAIGQDRRGKRNLSTSHCTLAHLYFQVNPPLAEWVAWAVAASLQGVHHVL
jgi:hypothetical protein